MYVYVYPSFTDYAKKQARYILGLLCENVTEQRLANGYVLWHCDCDDAEKKSAALYLSDVEVFCIISDEDAARMMEENPPIE